MKNFLLILWQLPQWLLGLVIIKTTKARRIVKNSMIVYLFEKETNVFTKYFSGVSLVNIILPISASDENTIKHEYGHCIQSKYFGWFYLLIIGLPSVCNNLWDRLAHKNWTREKRTKWYYSRYPEKWADKLGGVKR